MTGYDAWLERGADYGSDDFERWSQSPSAQEAYGVYCARANGDDEPLPFEEWLETVEANTAYDDALADEVEPEEQEPTPVVKHLWEIDHPYYCSESNYHDREVFQHFDSWADFYAEMGDADEDYNLVFRWDWRKPNPADYEDGEDVPGDTLLVFYMQQRRGLFMPVDANVTEADEPAVREWLTKCWAHMRLLWEGVS